MAAFSAGFLPPFRRGFLLHLAVHLPLGVDDVLKDERLGERLVELVEDAAVALDHVHQVLAGGLVGDVFRVGVEHAAPGPQALAVGVAGGDQLALGILLVALEDEFPRGEQVGGLLGLGAAAPIGEVHDVAVLAGVAGQLLVLGGLLGQLDGLLAARAGDAAGDLVVSGGDGLFRLRGQARIAFGCVFRAGCPSPRAGPR